MISNYKERKRREAEAAEVAALRGEMDAITASVAEAEGETSSGNHKAGELLVVNGRLCRTTRVIVRGERISEGINVERTSVADVVREINKGKE